MIIHDVSVMRNSFMVVQASFILIHVCKNVPRTRPVGVGSEKRGKIRSPDPPVKFCVIVIFSRMYIPLEDTVVILEGFLLCFIHCWIRIWQSEAFVRLVSKFNRIYDTHSPWILFLIVTILIFTGSVTLPNELYVTLGSLVRSLGKLILLREFSVSL